jgi:arylsulfatase A-like enzyme
MTFTDYYAENSCTAGRPSFITGQSPMRVDLTKVGAPGLRSDCRARDITIAQALKPLGYATGQFGKNHLGDRDEYLPTNHGLSKILVVLPHAISVVIAGHAALSLVFRSDVGEDVHPVKLCSRHESREEKASNATQQQRPR